VKHGVTSGETNFAVENVKRKSNTTKARGPFRCQTIGFRNRYNDTRARVVRVHENNGAAIRDSGNPRRGERGQ